MIYSWEESVKALRVDKKRSTRYERLVIISDHATGVSDYGSIRVFIGHLYTYDRILIFP